jgi:hypothetical protein
MMGARGISFLIAPTLVDQKTEGRSPWFVSGAFG